MTDSMEKIDDPYIRIVEQPARSAVRFRYECEGRSAGPIPGANSSAACATYPTIQIMNYSGSRAMIVVSCVTVSAPYRQHPHHLVGRVGCSNGICTMIVDNADHLCTFTHLGIQCAKRNEIANRLKLRRQLQIDPTTGGFDHINKSSRSLDLGAIRLCFQAFIEDPNTRKFSQALQPVVSNPVYDKKLLPKLIITDISTTSCPMTGGKVMLFCNYIDEEDIEVRFFEVDTNGTLIWEAKADLKPPIGEVHKRVGISLFAPAYPYRDTQKPVEVNLELRRPSDQRSSDPIVFTYLPDCGHEECPLLQFNRVNSSVCLTNTHSNTTNRKTRIKPNVSPKPKFSNKKIKVLDVLNASDTEDEETEYVDEEEGDMSPVHMHPFQADNQFVFQYLNQNYMKADINNNDNKSNVMYIQSNPNQSVCTNGSNNGNPSNDVLMECVKTIDMNDLASIQFTDFRPNEEEWTQLNQAVNYYNENYNYNEYPDNYHYYYQCQQPLETQEKPSFIDL